MPLYSRPSAADVQRAVDLLSLDEYAAAMEALAELAREWRTLRNADRLSPNQRVYRFKMS